MKLNPKQLYTEWLIWMEPLVPADILKDAAGMFLRFKDTVFSRRWISIRFLLISMGISILLTTTAILLSDYFWFRDGFHTVYFFAQRKLVSIYILNYVFQVATLAITVSILTLLVRASRSFGPLLLIADALIALVLALACWVAAASIEFPQSSPLSLNPPGFDADKLRRHVTLYAGYAQYIGLIDVDTVSSLGKATGGYIGQIKIFGGRLANWCFSNINFLPTVLVLLNVAFFSLSHLMFALFRPKGRAAATGASDDP